MGSTTVTVELSSTVLIQGMPRRTRENLELLEKLTVQECSGSVARFTGDMWTSLNQTCINESVYELHSRIEVDSQPIQRTSLPLMEKI